MKLVAEARRLISAVKGVSNAGIRQEVDRALRRLSKDERATLINLVAIVGAALVQLRDIDKK